MSDSDSGSDDDYFECEECHRWAWMDRPDRLGLCDECELNLCAWV